MARKARSQSEIEQIKDRIIEEAMRLILEAGFENMSIRKLAGRVGMSPTNIYYYYSGKDEIYLNIQIKGFQLLRQALAAVLVSEDHHESLGRILRAYLQFGFSNRDYYQIMLNSDTPRYLEYRDKQSGIEPVAQQAKQAAIDSIAVPLAVISRMVPEDEVFMRGYQMWVSLHGIVTLNNRNILNELDDVVPQDLIDRVCDDLLRNI